MSLRRVARDFSWQRCIRRPFHTGQARLQEPVMGNTASPWINKSPKVAQASDLIRVMSDEPIPEYPSNVGSLPSQQITNLVPPIQKPMAPLPKIVASAPVPPGYNFRAYSQAKTAAEENRDPTPKELDELFRLMNFDSPLGELRLEAHAIWKQMRSRKIIPTEKGYWALLRLAARVGDIVMQDEILESLYEDKVPITPRMLQALLEGMEENYEYERAIFLFRDIRARGVQPRAGSYRFMISMCININEAEEAFRLLVDFKDNYPDVGEQFWWYVLESCARNGFLEGVLHCWQYIQETLNVPIPEGLCLQVLSVAARQGQPALATSVFGALSDLGVQYSSHHFLPLIEAYSRSGDLRQAFIALGIMREASTSPPQLSHLNTLVEAIAQSPETLDRAFFTLQDIVQKEGKAIDITAFNAVLSACLILNDASRAISSYRDAASLNVVPNLETYNILLHAASKVGHRELAMYILSDLKKAQITPNQDTYARVILTCLFEPEGSYDQAFIYLEEMKASGWIPSSGLYASFVKKCVYHNDDRVVTVLEEMKKMGYSTKSLETYVMDAARLGIRSKLMDRKTKLTQPDLIEDEAVQRYLEWKGERS